MPSKLIDLYSRAGVKFERQTGPSCDYAPFLHEDVPPQFRCGRAGIRRNGTLPNRTSRRLPIRSKQKRPPRNNSERIKDLERELDSQYKKWLNEDVVYIITPEEKNAFLHLSTNEEREQFIEQFWQRRNPDPDSAGKYL